MKAEADNVKVSIITTVYKAEKDLPRLLESMMALKSQELEFFLIDNGSPDRCGVICHEYAKKDSRFIVRTLTENIGYIRARNLGIQEVDSDYIGFCDSDDYLEPEGYDRAIEILKATNCDLYLTAYNTVTNGKAVKCLVPYTCGLYEGQQVQDDILPQAFGPLPNKPVLHGFAWKQIFRRSLFIDNNLSFLPELQPYEDQVLNIDFIKKSKSVYVDDCIIYNYVVNSESITAKLAAQFDPEKEMQRLKLFYMEKEKRVNCDSQRVALANLMCGFFYSIFSNAVKVELPLKEVSLKLTKATEVSFIKRSTEYAHNTNMVYGAIRWLMIHRKYYLFLFIFSKLNKFRKLFNA